MPLSQSDLCAMVAAASTIPERLSNHLLHERKPLNDELLQKRLNAWCQTSTAGNWQQFQERLSWDGLDLPKALRLLAPCPWPEQASLPGWTTILQEVLSLLEMMPDQYVLAEKGHWPFLDANTPLPFEELLAPFVSLAQGRLLAQAGTAANLLTDTVHLTLQRHLLQVLTSLSLPTLQAEFARSRTQAAGSDEQREGMQCYQHFLRLMCRGGLAALLQSYSVLARLLTTTCDLWVEANVEFVQRLQADWPDLVALFGARGEVTEIQPALSDMHAGRRGVMALTFAGGSRLIYKPRSIGIEEAYAHLLRWCNEQGATPPFKVLTILDRISYGWVEFVAYEPCQDQQMLRRYYQRAGMMLCLIYILGGMNCFYDHLIAHGEQPVLVDASYLLHPNPNPNPQRHEGEDWEQEVYSALHTGLLASWQLPPAGSAPHTRETRHAAADISGLCVSLEDRSSRQEARQQLPEPPLPLKYGSLKACVPLNVASSVEASEGLREEELLADLSTGFQRMYQLFLRQRATLLGAGSPLQAVKAQVVRMAYRDRSVYERLFPKLLAPQALQDAVTRSILLEGLGDENVPIDWFRASKRDHAHWWPVFAAERQALLQGDIPVVSARAQSDALLIGPDQEVESSLCQPAFDLMLSRLERLSDEDLSRQLALLQQALPKPLIQTVSSREVTEQHDPTDKPSQAHAFITLALSIADDIVRRTVEIEQGNVLWVKPEASYRFQQSQLRPMRYGFSNGVSGIAFFLAALAQQTGITSYGRLSCAALRPLRHLVRDERERLVREMGLGAAFGLGSVVYALTRISQFLDAPELLADASAAASLITPDLVAEDQLLDVFVGTAGAILGLLALYEALPEQEYLDRAMCCGQHLLRARTPSKAACRAWPTSGGRHMTGFSHGTAGIVYALLRLYELTGDTSLFEAAQEGLRYEDRALVRERGNWAGEVDEGGSEFGHSWCHGAPGIGLARIGGLPMLDTVSIRQDIELALQTTQQMDAIGPDHLCCGISGRVEILLTSAQRLNRPELADVAVRSVRQLLTRAEQRGGFTFGSFLPTWVARPELFHGTAGIGYTLLHLAEPDALPSPLLWE